ncbi:PD-(D/E)XK nuclease superfamily protein [Marinobacter sp. LV10R510-11A]|uniref:PD-(D/E)XK nuclease family protein n=1 Tax=Marinobacter sp. LV10R510-11A TaxID=1415568 RepID=UPI000BB714C9|nr:PD-(D/E)XK nuclease family protein [Marinobacter sp. LV10R510-11A]SOB74730.1 PD-(D/E)XK nuclease superfamily protein [Marinobacter sp. LV10R510-11A]
MDFILVSDALTASEARYALAQRNTMGAKVGSFSVLLEALAELWLIEPSELDWDVALQEYALSMQGAFWARSIQVDEPATVAELKASLRFLLNHLPLGIQPVEILEPASRYERYYNDLVCLLKNIGERPAQDELAEQWVIEHEGLCIESLYVYQPVNTECLYPWQQQVLDILAEKGWLAPEPEKYNFIQQPIPASESAPIQKFAQTLFRPESGIVANDDLYWLTCRDQVQEVEAVTSLIQSALDNGTAPECIAVTVPRGGDYEAWLVKHFEHAGIIASNLRSNSGVFDWQSALVHDLLTGLIQNDIPMASMSVMINPLMPWSASIGHKLAEQLGEGRELDPGVELSAEGQAMLELLQNLPEQTPAAIMSWLNAVVAQCGTARIKGLGKQRLKALVESTRRLLALYGDFPFEEQLKRVVRQTPVATLESQDDRVRYLHAINIIQEGEPLPFQVDELFVIGFNQGHYSYQPEHTAPIHRDAWDQLASTVGLAIPTAETSLQQWQKEFTELLGRVDSRITFIRAMNDYQGKSLEPSETLLDMALCFQPLAELDPEQLERPVMQSSHPLLRTISSKLDEQDKPKLENLQLEQELLHAVRHQQDGTIKPESTSSLEKLMQSPLAWLLYRLGIKPQVWEPQTPTISVQGTVAHKVFELFSVKQGDPWSEALFDELFSQSVEQEASFLDSPQWRLKRTQLRNKVYKALDGFCGWCEQEKWDISDTELELQGELWGTPLRGFVDAVLTNGNQTLIVDYKTSKHKQRLKQLEAGYDLQTLIYRELYQQKNAGSQVMSGYYTLNDTTLLADRSLSASDRLSVVQPSLSLDEQSASAVELVEQRLGELESGTIKLNQTSDDKTWDKRGIKAYALTNNPVVTRFTRDSEEEAV